MALRARIDNDPRMQELRDRIERVIGVQSCPTVWVKVDAQTSVKHPLASIAETITN